MNDKKKLMIVIALGVVVLAVGAFQFTQMSGGEAKPQATAKREVKPVEDGTGTGTEVPDAMAQILKIGTGPQRDPFVPGPLEQLPDSSPQPTQKEPTVVNPGRRPNRGGLGSIPTGFEGNPPPWRGDPNGPLIPNVGGGNGNGGNGGTSVTPTVDPDAFRYTVTGVIDGAKPAAIFTDPAGNQQLVRLGGSPGEGSQLVSVDRGRVVVKHKGKTLTFNVGGTPNVK